MHGDACGGSEAAGARDAGVADDADVHGDGAAAVGRVLEARAHHVPPHGPPLPHPRRVARAHVHHHGAALDPRVRCVVCAVRPPPDRRRAWPLAAAAHRRRPRPLGRRHGGRGGRGDQEVEGDPRQRAREYDSAASDERVLAHTAIQHHGRRSGKKKIKKHNPSIHSQRHALVKLLRSITILCDVGLTVFYRIFSTFSLNAGNIL